jgi:hypothetical protein
MLKNTIGLQIWLEQCIYKLIIVNNKYIYYYIILKSIYCIVQENSPGYKRVLMSLCTRPYRCGNISCFLNCTDVQ